MSEPTIEFIPFTVNLITAGNNLLIPSNGKRRKIWQVWIYNAAAQNLELLAGTRSLTGPLTGFPGTSAVSLPYQGKPHHILEANEDLYLKTSAATQVSGFINYTIE